LFVTCGSPGANTAYHLTERRDRIYPHSFTHTHARPPKADGTTARFAIPTPTDAARMCSGNAPTMPPFHAHQERIARGAFPRSGNDVSAEKRSCDVGPLEILGSDEIASLFSAEADLLRLFDVKKLKLNRRMRAILDKGAHA